MSTLELIRDLRRRSILLTIEGDEMGIDAPAGAVTVELRSVLADRRSELVAVLAGNWSGAAASLMARYIGRLADAEFWMLDARYAARVRAGLGRGEPRAEAERAAYTELGREIEGEKANVNRD